VQKILVATDFSSAGERATRIAANIARQTRAALRIVHVVPAKRSMTKLWRVSSTAVAAIHQRAGEALKRAADALDPERQMEVSTGVISGTASVEIARAAEDFGADLLVVGALGEHETRSRHVTLGGTSSKLLDMTPVPLLLTRVAATPAAPVIAAIDLSPVSSNVLAWARAISPRGADITVAHVYEAPFADRIEAYGLGNTIQPFHEEEQHRREREVESLIELANGTGAMRATIQRGDPIDRLFSLVEALQPGIIVVGKHQRRRGRKAGQGGSVSRHLAMWAPTNVLIVTEDSAP
jgi:nucleotide-binding universal stress UspA family protein